MFPPVLSTDFFMSAYYHFGNKKAVRDDSIEAYYKRPNTVHDVLMKKTRNRLKYLQIRETFPNLAGFHYEPSLDFARLLRNLTPGTACAASLYSSFEAIAFVLGSLAFYAKSKTVGYTWRKAKSTKLHDVSTSISEFGQLADSH
jgi:AcrR family transcriptional regulator